jgi:glycosyltransferase involved in cell wall biosynthesis
MLISIIINNYNYGRFVRQAIESGLAQTYTKVEVIVVDDGSTDNSRAIIAAFDGRITSILKENGGQASALNAGYKASKGDLVLFLDSDDALSPKAIERVVAAWDWSFAKLHFPLETIGIQGESKNRLFPDKKLDSGNVLTRLLMEGDYCSPPTSGNVFSRVFLSNIMPMPEPEWRECADCYLVANAPFFGDIGVINDPLGVYRLHGSSITAFVADGRLRSESLQKRLNSDLRKQRLLNKLSAAYGEEAKANSVLSTYTHLKVRLASLKMFPEAHPFQSDRLWSTLLKMTQTTYSCKSISPATRAALCAWGLAIAALPKLLAEQLIIIGLSPYSRSQFWSVLKRSAAAHPVNNALTPDGA